MFVFFCLQGFFVGKYQWRTTPSGCVCLCVRGRKGGAGGSTVKLQLYLEQGKKKK